MEFSRRPTPARRKDETPRIILHFDYDCFYAQVRENQNPALRSLPLGIKQKNILATCNYVARARGVTKLSIIADARRICPDLVTVDGEDLTDFRDVSKRLFGLLKGYSWNGKVERLGLDEVWMDVSDIVDWNVGCLSRGNLQSSWFCLVRENPEVGFEFDASVPAGCTVGDALEAEDLLAKMGEGSDLKMMLIVASHLARYLRLKIEEEGYTSACGIATNKTLAKLAGNVNKPRNQTTLLCDSPSSPAVLGFMDGHRLRKVPGIGAKTTHILEDYVYKQDTKKNPGDTAATDTPADPPSIKVHTIRTHPTASQTLIERLLSGPGTEKGIGEKVWNLLHGIDPSPVKDATDIPTQISIEDTYKGLATLEEITGELHKLSTALLRRMHVDLLDVAAPDPTSQAGKTGNGTAEADPKKKRWLARPKTLRLTTRPKFALTPSTPYNYQRATRSQPLPSFIFHLGTAPAAIIARLVPEYLLPMFRYLNPDPSPGSTYNIGLLNVCVGNMIPTAADGAGAIGRDIAGMFARQGDVRREFTVYDDTPEKSSYSIPPLKEEKCEEVGYDTGVWIDDEEENENEDVQIGEIEELDVDADDSWEDSGGYGEECTACGRVIPRFAYDAHQRYHQLGD